MRVRSIRSPASTSSSGGSAIAVSSMTSTATPPAPNRIDRPEDRIAADAEDQFLRLLAHDHRLHGKAVDVAHPAPARGPALRLPAPLLAPLAASRCSSTTPPMSDLCEIALDSSLTTTLSELSSSLAAACLRLARRSARRRSRAPGCHRRRLPPWLPARSACAALPRPPGGRSHSTASRSAVDILAAARRHPHQRLLRARPVAQIGNGGCRIGRRLEACHAGLAAGCGGRHARRVLAEPAGEDRLAVDHSLRWSDRPPPWPLRRRGQPRRTVQHQQRIGSGIALRPPRPPPCSARADASPMMSTGLACDQVGGSARVQGVRSSPAKAPPVRRRSRSAGRPPARRRRRHW